MAKQKLPELKNLPSNLHQVACKAVVGHSDEAPAPCFQLENLNVVPP